MSIPVNILMARYMDLVSPGEESKFMRVLNEAESRLQESARWHWSKVEVDLPVQSRVVYLDPTIYAALLGVLVDGTGRVIRPRDVEFTPNQGYRHSDSEVEGYLIDDGLVSVDDVMQRKYRIVDNVADGDTVTCLVLLAHRELGHMDDLTTCPSARALKLAMYAVNYEEVNDLERAQACWSQAYAALDEDERTKRGGSRSVMPVQPFGEGISSVDSLI